MGKGKGERGVKHTEKGKLGLAEQEGKRMGRINCSDTIPQNPTS